MDWNPILWLLKKSKINHDFVFKGEKSSCMFELKSLSPSIDVIKKLFHEFPQPIITFCFFNHNYVSLYFEVDINN